MTRKVSAASPTTVAPGMERTIQPRNKGGADASAAFCTVRKIAESGTWSGGRLTQDCTLTVRSPSFAWPPTGIETCEVLPSTSSSTPSVAVFPGSQVLGMTGATSGGGGVAGVFGAAAAPGAELSGVATLGKEPSGADMSGAAGGTGVCTRPGGGAAGTGWAGGAAGAAGAATTGGAGGT